jgi:hypothetical protein
LVGAVVLRTLMTAAAAAVIAAPAGTAATAVFPAVTYSHVLRFTPRGTVSLHIVRGPRPVGRYELQPVLSNGSILGRQTVSSMERGLTSQATSIGVNGDFFNWNTGRPTGLLMRNGAIDHQPHPGRASLGVDATGVLHIGRVSLDASWQGEARAHPIQEVNEPARPNHTALYTPAWAAATPATELNAVTVVLANVPPPVPGTDVHGEVVAVGDGTPTRVPPGGAVLVARGPGAAALLNEAPPGSTMHIGLTLTPWASGIVGAVGGGPLLVRNGRSTVDTSEELSPTQLFAREPRTAVGQRADGGIVLLVADGRQSGSVGITNGELAAELVRAGCATGMSLDSGGSSTVALEGNVLNHPSDRGGERPVAEALLLTYTGVYALFPTTPIVSPNGDGYGERQRLGYKLVRSATVAATVVAPDGTEQQVDAAARAPGRYTFNWDGSSAAEGTWRWRVTAADDQGETKAERTFHVDRTLGFVTASAAHGRVTVRLTLARPADVRAADVGGFGEPLRRVHAGELAVGRKRLRFSARDGNGRRLRGTYTLTVSAASSIGTTRQSVRLRVR